MRTVIKSVFLALFVILIFKTPAFGKSGNTDISGTWQGVLSVSGTELRIVFHVNRTSSGDYVSTMDSPDQGATGINVSNTSVKGDTVIFELPSIRGTYRGIINKNGKSITGTWQQRSYSFPLNLNKTVKETSVKRPQEPKKPYPYKLQNVSFKNKAAGVTLAGTLTLPKSGGPFPAVILITGSGPQDRNETIFNHRPFLVIADYLTRRGIAVLRYDDRGVGKSTGNFATATTLDFAGDAESAVNYLKTRKDINKSKIGLIGHSEGGLIAPLVASKDRSVDFIILMAGPGLPGYEILDMQSRLIAKASGESEKTIEKNMSINDRVYNTIKTENDSSKAYRKIKMILTDYVNGLSKKEQKQIGDKNLFIKKQMASIMSPWFRFFVKYDPRPTLEKVKCPVLAIGGSKDLQVPAKANLAAIKKALKEGGNRDFTVKELPGLNHLFQDAKTGLPSEYGKIEETISPRALKVMGDWILKRVK